MYRSGLPHLAALPRLTDEEVARFVAAGKQGWARVREENLDGADASFRAQIAIFPGNPEPYVARALLAAGRKDDKTALAQLKEAVLRGFTDFPRLDRSEQWRRLRRNETYLGLIDTVPGLLAIEGAWPAWKDLRADQAPKDVRTALADRAALEAAIDRMAPALGPRLASLGTARVCAPPRPGSSATWPCAQRRPTSPKRSATSSACTRGRRACAGRCCPPPTRGN